MFEDMCAALSFSLLCMIIKGFSALGRKSSRVGSSVTGKILLVTLHSLMHFADSLEKKIIGKMERGNKGGKACCTVSLIPTYFEYEIEGTT